MKLKSLLAALHIQIGIDSAKEVTQAIELILDVESFNSGQKDCIKASYLNGPLFDGDVPSKQDRDILVNKGYMAKVVVKGEEGYNACTYKGLAAYRLLQVMNS